MARAVVAAAQYRADKGKWPDGLEELVPRYMSEVPRERFSATGTEIVGYRKTNAGICLYARGLKGSASQDIAIGVGRESEDNGL